jgi:hypothetical protein
MIAPVSGASALRATGPARRVMSRYYAVLPDNSYPDAVWAYYMRDPGETLCAPAETF